MIVDYDYDCNCDDYDNETAVDKKMLDKENGYKCISISVLNN